MGVDISGGMIVGANASEIDYDTEEFECGEYYREHHGMKSYSLHYDACESSQIWGFSVEDVEIDSDEFDEWCISVKLKAKKFEEITGVKASLIGSQDVW